MLITAQIDFHNRKKKYYGSQWVPSIVWLSEFKIFSFVFNRKKLIQVWNNMRVS